MVKTAVNRKKAAKEFAEFWKERGDEKQHTQTFWLSLLRNVLGIQKPEIFIDFEKRVKINGTKYIDAYIAQTNVAVEQKSATVNLDKKEMQSDGSMLTPYEQAKRYNDNLRYSERCRWIVVSNFSEIRIYDMETEEPEKHFESVFLKDLYKDFDRLQFLVDSKKSSVSPEEQVSLKAGELVGKLYDALFKEYIDPDENSFRSLNILCVRIVFCLYAEDAGLFETRNAFEDYIKSFSPENLRDGIIKLFKALDTKPENRDKYDTKINSFPYVNGGLFADLNIEIPNFTEEIVDVIVNFCAPFDWSKISPTIFGAVFESTLNPETRRKGGMHYTSIENIHKVIDPLFLDDLKREFTEIVERFPETSHKSSYKTKTTATVKETYQVTSLRKRNAKLEDFRNKLATLTFLDPACGSGNFLTETYISLRRLENECLKVVHGSQTLISSEDFSPIKVKISQFYGIEINDFAVTVAKTALWIAESQMMKETEEIVERDLDFLPLSTSATIVEGNALRMDWATLKTYEENNKFYRIFAGFEPETDGTRHEYDYIMGNPPFVGARLMSESQKKDVLHIFENTKNVGNLDYVSCWYKKTADLIKNSETKAALVSTNSITQGEQPAILWKPLFKDGIRFDFAWRTFRWDSESTQKAHVHCVIIGFSKEAEISSSQNSGEVKNFASLYNADGTITKAKNINGYLLDAPNIFVESRPHPLCDVPEIGIGNKPIDGGNYLFTEDEMKEFIRKEPASEKYFKKWTGSDEFINRYWRYCLWLGDCSPAEIKKMPECYKRVQAVREFRLASKSAPTQKLAETPTRFHVENFPKGNYIVIPEVSSEKRRYIPMGFLSPEIFCSNLVKIIPDATLYNFGVLTSSVHNAWMRAVCGRLESRYRYSKDIVYNNFPWPDVLPDGRKMHANRVRSDIEQTAQAILDARAKYPDSSLADLYDETTMPQELRKAHKENDRAVMQAYGFNPKMTEAEIVAELFKMYEKLVK